MSLPDSGLLNFTVERGDGDVTLTLRIKGENLPIRGKGRQWRMEFWDEDRTELFCDAAGNPQEADGNEITLVFTENELSRLPATFWGDLLVVLENGRRRYLFRVHGTATGSGILIDEVLINLAGEPVLPPEWTPLLDRAVVNSGLEVDRFVAGDPYYANVVLLLHMDGSNGGTTFVDNSQYQRAITANGDAALSTAQVRFGASSGYFDGSGDTLTWANSSDFAFGTGDFTVECFFRPDEVRNGGIFQQAAAVPQASTTNSVGLGVNITGTWSMYANNTAYSSSATYSAGQWYHVAVVRWSGVTKLYVNGVQVQATADTTNYTGTAATIGVWYSAPFYAKGFIDEFRVTKGVARYTGVFTPPTEPFLDRAGGPASPYTPLQETYYRIDRTLLNSLLEADYSSFVPYTPLQETIYRIDRALTNSAVVIDRAVVNYGMLAPAPLLPVLTMTLDQASPRVQLEGDEYWDNVSLLLHMDGSNGSTTFTDSSSNVLTVTANGSAQVNTAQSKFGGGSVYFANNGHLAVAASSLMAFGLGDYTVEFFIYRTGTGNDQGIFTFGGMGSGLFAAMDGASLEVGLFGGGTAALTGGTINLNTWHHVAITMAAGTMRGFVDGVQFDSNTPVVDLTDNELKIGYSYTSSFGMTGYVDEFRVTKGVARYTANFTPPAGPFPDGSTPIIRDEHFFFTPVLVHFNGTNGSTTFTNSGYSSLTLTSVTGAAISTAQAMFGSSSGLFDGTNDYLSLSLPVGCVGDYTLEAFVYPTERRNSGLIAGSGTANLGRWYVNSSGYLVFTNPANTVYSATTGIVPLNQWSHVALTRTAAGALKMYLNGAEVYSTTGVTGAHQFNRIGAHVDNGWYWKGYMDDVRITNGVCRYSTTFEPPGLVFPDVGPVVDNGNFLSSIQYSQSSLYNGPVPAYNVIMQNNIHTDVGTGTNGSGTQWIRMDLGEVKNVVQVKIGTVSNLMPGGWSKSYTAYKDIRYSTDASSWTTAFNTNEMLDGISVYGVNFSARYIEMYNASGYVALSEFVPVISAGGSGDPYFANVIALLHFDGTDGSTTIIDSSSYGWAFTASGSAALSTADPKYGSACLALDGTDDFVQGPADAVFALGTGDFTIEFWVYLNVVNDNDGIFTFGGTNSGLALSTYNGNYHLTTSGGGGGNMGAATAGQWTHIAITRTNGVYRFFVDGVLRVAASMTTNFTDNQLKIGYYYSSFYGLNGRIDEFRVTKGVSRYSGNFTPPAAAFPDS